MANEWRDHPTLKGRFLPGHPDDLQVITDQGEQGADKKGPAGDPGKVIVLPPPRTGQASGKKLLRVRGNNLYPRPKIEFQVHQPSRTACARLLQFMVHKCHGSATEESSMRAYLLSLGVALVLGLPGFAQQSNEPSAVERLLVTLHTGNESPPRGL